MTNADKFIKEGTDKEKFCYELARHLNTTVGNDEARTKEFVAIIDYFLNCLCVPTLTEDERVILRNLRYEKGAYEYTKIGRTELDSEGNCDLILIDSDDESVWWGEYGHLFKFIQEGEEYSIEELLGNDNK